MTTILTNIYDNFSADEKLSLAQKYKEINVVSLEKYQDKSLNENVSKFVLKNSNIVDALNKSTLWNSMTSLIKDLYIYARNKVETNSETQVWLIDSSKKPAINVAFSIKDWTNISDLMTELKATLLNYEKQKTEKATQIVWISYNADQKTWGIKKL